jgi:hypothetical protein
MISINIQYGAAILLGCVSKPVVPYIIPHNKWLVVIKDTKTVPIRLSSRLNKRQNTNKVMDHIREMSAIDTWRLDSILRC